MLHLPRLRPHFVMVATTLLLLPACSPQALPPGTHERPAETPQAQPAAAPLSTAIAQKPSPALVQDPSGPVSKAALEGRISASDAGPGKRRLQLRMALPGADSDGFSIQRFACADVAYAKVQIIGVGMLTTIYADGSDGQNMIPVSGCQVDATFSNIPFGPARAVRIELYDDQRQALAGAVSQTVFIVDAATESIEISFRQLPAAQLATQLLSGSPADLFLATKLTPDALQTFFDAVMDVSGSFPDYDYGTHPLLVNVDAVLADLRANGGNLAALDPENPAYVNAPGSVSLELSGLLSGESIIAKLDDPLSDNQTVSANGTVSITDVPPGNWTLTLSGAGYVTRTIPATVVAGQPLLLGAQAIKPEAPVITGFSASTRWPGSPLTLNGTDLRATQTNYVVTVGGQAATITGGDTDQLDITVPSSLGGGNHAVTVQLGTSDVTQAGTLSVVNPSITSMTTSGITGSEVVITGTNFSDIEAENKVSFNGQPMTVTNATPTQIKFNVPAGATGVNAVSLQIYDSAVVSAGNFTVTPNITSFLPGTSGRIGNTISIEGTGFDPDLGDNTISINGGTPFAPSGGDADTLQFVVPAGSHSDLAIRVHASGQTSAPATFGVIPTLNPLSDTSGNVDDEIIVSGTGFDPTFANNRVVFAGVEATPTAGSATSLTVKVPAGAFGNAAVAVKTANRTSTETPRTFTVIPTITMLSDTDGNIGTPLAITGTGFAPTPSDNIISFGGQTFQPDLASSTQLSLDVPGGACGIAAITVRTDGVSGPVSTEPHTFTVIPTLDVTTPISPNFGTIGSTVTINGTGFCTANPNANNTVMFGGTHLATVTGAGPNGTSLQVTVPTGLAGTVGFSVDTTGVPVSLNNAFSVVPTISNITTATSFTPGETITITGNGFNPIGGNNIVKFNNGSNTPATRIDATTLQVQIPAGLSGTQSVTVTNSGNSRTSAGFNISVGAVLSSLSPNFAQKGTVITLTGAGFLGVDQVLFGTTPAAFTIVDNATITATVPSTVYGSMDVTVVDGGASSVPKSFGVQAVLSPSGPTLVLPGQDLNFTIDGIDPSAVTTRTAMVDGVYTFIASINNLNGSIHIFNTPAPFESGPHTLVVEFLAGDSTALNFCVTTCSETD